VDFWFDINEGKQVTLGGIGPVNLCIWDTAGQERFQSLIPLYTCSASLAIITAAINDARFSRGSNCQFWNTWKRTHRGNPGKGCIWSGENRSRRKETVNDYIAENRCAGCRKQSKVLHLKMISEKTTKQNSTIGHLAQCNATHCRKTAPGRRTKPFASENAAQNVQTRARSKRSPSMSPRQTRRTPACDGRARIGNPERKHESAAKGTFSDHMFSRSLDGEFFVGQWTILNERRGRQRNISK
jgi:hypothetical protein